MMAASESIDVQNIIAKHKNVSVCRICNIKQPIYREPETFVCLYMCERAKG
jgi:hypothetical protein